MTKTQMKRAIANLLETIGPDNMDRFREERGLSYQDYYPYILGYIQAELKIIASEENI